MSKEIILNFNMIFWVSINWKKNYGYVTRLKSRIYKSVLKKANNQTKKLQMKLFISLAANLLAINEISKQQTCFLENMNDLEKLYFIQNINYIKTCSSDLFRRLHLRDIFCQELRNSIDKNLLFYVLEPQYTFYYQSNEVHFLPLVYAQDLLKLLNIDLVQLTSEKLFFINFIYKDFICKLSEDYLLARVNLTQVIYTKLKSVIFKKSWLEFCNNSRKYISFTYNLSEQFQLERFISRIILYSLFLETSFVARSYKYPYCNLFNYKYHSIKICDYGLELFIYSNSLFELKRWLIIFFQLVYSHINKLYKVLLRTTTTNNDNLNFCGYIIIIDTYQRIYFLPNKLSQIVLLSQIKKIFKNGTANSAIFLIKNLNFILEKWVSYFKCAGIIKIFMLIDYLIYLKLWAWAHRVHNNWSSKQIKKKYFTCFLKYTLVEKYHGWIFSFIDIENRYYKHIFLIKLIWFTSISCIY